MKNKISCILGEYMNNTVKIIILSKETYVVNLNVNKNYIKNFIIKKYESNILVLENINEGFNYYILFINNKNNKPIEKININLEKNPFNNVKIVNCDSNLGFETNTWKLINNKFGIIFHLGDFLYNDLVFRKYYKYLIKNNIDYKSIKQSIYEELYDNYIECITRKQNYLKNNFNYIMTDDHEIVDNNYYDKNKNNKIFRKIYKLFKEVKIKILHNTRFVNNKIDFVKDDTNKTVYVLNYDNIYLNSDTINKYNIYNNIKQYKNIFFLERKCFSSSKPTLLSSIIFQEKEINNNNNYLYELFDSLYHNKKDVIINVISGDYHIISNMDIYNKKFNNKICSIKNVGAINTCVDIFSSNLFLDSKNYVSKNEDIKYRNGFIYINYKKDEIIIKSVMNTRTNLIYNIINNIITGIKLV
jgi:hypothetical protein